MAKFELKLPKMGESVAEATINTWLKDIGDVVDIDESVIEISTDKVDSDVPSEVSGILIEKKFEVDAVVQVGQTFAIIETDGDVPNQKSSSNSRSEPEQHQSEPTPIPEAVTQVEQTVVQAQSIATPISSNGSRFYSPLVKNIAKKERIPLSELDSIEGTGKEGRLTKDDLLKYLNNRTGEIIKKPTQPAVSKEPIPRSIDGDQEIIEMDRMRRLIAEHMVKSKKTSPHVTSFVEVDVTNIVNWRNKVKDEFFEKFGEKITFTPIFIEAVTAALRAFPMVNISLEGTTIIKKHRINIGMATALPGGNLIVPVIKNADHLSLLGLTKQVNQLADKARTNRLKPEDIQEGTFTVTNVGTFGNVMGTPIINQPQVAILAVGAIRKKPAVVETEYGDLIAVRHMMFLSLSYDHRIVDGFLGGSFLRKVGDLLEQFDVNRAL